MSETSNSRINRRQFLRTAAALTGGVALLGSCRSWQSTSAPASGKSARWAFLSDTHIPADRENNYRGFYPYQNLQKVVPQIARDPSEGLIITGDLARLEGFPDDYKNARTLLAPLIEQRPVCVALGNHDNRKNFLKPLPTPAPASKPFRENTLPSLTPVRCDWSSSIRFST